MAECFVRAEVVSSRGIIIWIVKLPSKFSIASEVMNGEWRGGKSGMNSYQC